MNFRGFYGSFLRMWKDEIGQNRDCVEQYKVQSMGVDVWFGCWGFFVVIYLNKENGNNESIFG